MELNVVTGEIAKLSLQDGDMLVLTLPGDVPQDVRNSIGNSLSGLVPRGVNVVVLADGAQMTVVRREDMEEAAAVSAPPPSTTGLIMPPSGLMVPQ